MPYEIVWETSGVHLIFAGLVTGEQTKEAGNRIYSHADFDSLRYQIFDFTGVEDVKLTVDEMKEMAAIDSVAASTNPRIQLAIVSTSETVMIANAVYAAEYPDLPWETKEFRTLVEARAWVEG